MNSLLLKEKWLEAAGIYTDNGDQLWSDIERKYTGSNRYYHNLQHLHDMYTLLHDYYKGDVPFITLIALFYHDFEYNTLRNDNEQRSAAHAVSVMQAWNADTKLAKQVSDMILATANHHGEISDTELNTFLDADMAVLGFESPLYKRYASCVKQEFNAYPEFIFNRGRRQFIERVLERDFIYATSFFRQQFEVQARINLQNELKSLR